MSAYSSLAISWLLSPDIEGVHSDDPVDPGGDTWYGLSRKAHPDQEWPPTREQAEQVYLQKYWHPCRCDDFPSRIAVVLFDSAIQHGQSNAVQLLQSALGVTADGVIGPVTLNAAHQRNDLCIADFLSYRARFYSAICINDPSQTRFIRGWMRRLFLLQALVLAIREDQ